MFNHRHYVPILKWKMGEYQALSRLAGPVKDRITPLLEIPPVGFDFETQRNKESADDHLGDFGKRLKSKWQARPCFVDLKHLPAATRCAGGRHCVEVLFETARAEGCAAIPVVSFANDAAFLAAVATVSRQDRRGVCLRLSLPDFDRHNLQADIENLLRPMADGYGECDLVIDLGTPTYVPIAIMVTIMQTLMARSPCSTNGAPSPSPARPTRTRWRTSPRRTSCCRAMNGRLIARSSQPSVTRRGYRPSGTTPSPTLTWSSSTCG